MSNNASQGNDSPLPPRRPGGSTAAADVSFAKLNNEHHAESSSVAGSSSSVSMESHNSDSNMGGGSRRGEWQNFVGPDDRSSRGSTPKRSRTSGGFLLDSVFANGKPRGPHREAVDRRESASHMNGTTHVDKRRHVPDRASAESSQRASPVSREVSRDGSASRVNPKDEHLRPPGMDPAQLVQMALNLSESRKRHVSSTLPLPAAAAAGRRIVSALDSGYSTVRSASSTGQRSDRVSDGVLRAAPDFGRRSQHVTGQPEGAADVLYTLSPATLSRAERVRRYFELASEHRRLLEYLPPLKSDTTAPGNYTIQAMSSPGSANFEMSRVPTNTNSKRKLGRAYNPLQALRNRRLRNRERRPLPASPDTWQEADRIKHWVDGVAASSNDLSFRPGEDRVRLPAFAGELETGPASPEQGKRHRRSDTASSVITRPENGWSIEPAELLADAYWLEKDDNKTVVEDRDGNRIFPARLRLSVDMPRHSVESRRSHESNGLRQSQYEPSDDDERPRTRRKLVLPIPGRLRRHHVSRSASATSESSDEGRKPPPLRYGDNEGGDENVGPLERHMRRMIAKEERGELSSPEAMSPNHWNSRYTPFLNSQSNDEKSRRDMDTTRRRSSQIANGGLSVGLAANPSHRRSRSSDSRTGPVDHGVSSMDDLMSDSPTASLAAETAHSTQQGFALLDKRTTQSDKGKKHRLPALHPHTRNKSKDRNNIERTDFASSADAYVGQPLSPVLSADTSTGQPRSSFESSRPFVKRHRTNDSNGSSLWRVDTSTTNTGPVKEGYSSFGRRFFKGSRTGDLSRSDGARLGDRFRESRDHLEQGVASDLSRLSSDVSDTENDIRGAGQARRDEFAATDSHVSPKASFERDRTKSKFYTSNLPSFTRQRSLTNGTPSSDPRDPFFEQGGRTQQADSARLAPPRIQLPDDEGLSEPDLPSGKSNRFLDVGDYDRRKSMSQDNLSQVPTSSTNLSRGKRKDSWQISGVKSHDAKRHWSISDRSVPPEQRSVVSHRDIARARALLLASGIKAHQINLKADTARDKPLPLMIKAAQTAGVQWTHVSRKEEHIVASQMLKESLSSTLSKFEDSLIHFQSNTAKGLGSRLEGLTHRVAEQLTKIVHETSDDADAFNVELTTKQPQEVKRVDEAVDAMFRQRRRQFRLVRRAGFKLLEWVVLGIMWWIWFIVVLINMLKRGMVGTFRVFRWLLWS
ncbi:hypothetical protein DOTSEDRAFT_40414 [Dothistroma septosporum NZE10]|uniref:Uncharacterized protein n=1 Tax=Dothistroma septosporum (strain NZE10 / CBS 128990) TaxID=675120 RepID=N1Q0I4_DOTSN|nr:hypothetical protein DOTSEDRAFT_40414 [Dothistroma septosporum NZE10]